MNLHCDGRTSLILALSTVVWCGCGSSSTSGQPSQMPSAGSAGSLGGAASAGASAGGSSGASVSGAGTSSGAGAPSTTAGASGALATGGAPGGGGAPSGAGSGGASNTGGAGGAASVGVPFVYVGGTAMISIFKLDATLGKLTFVKSIDGGNTPSFLSVDPAHAHLYAVNEDAAMVASFAINQQTGDLTFLNRVASGGTGPAFVSVDHSGKFVLVANYDGGTTRIFPIAADGSLGAPTDNKTPGMNSHMIVTDPANHFAFVMNLGSDTIVQYVFDAATGTLKANAAPFVKTAAKAGPRHLAFHPNGKFAYVIDELDNTLTAYSYDAALGQLNLLQMPQSTLPAGNTLTSAAGEVVVAPSGNFVFGSNRGHDSIVTFSVDAAGKLTFVGTTPSGGTFPRSFTLSADGKLMLVTNESGNVTSFSVDVQSGALKKLLSVTVPVKPQFVGIVTLPGATP